MGGERQFQVAIVLGITAVVHDLLRLDPERRRGQQFKRFAASILGKDARKFRPRQWNGPHFDRTRGATVRA